MPFITQIQLGDKGYIDITDDVAVPLNFAVAEIQDISKKQGGFSKTIKAPGTANNNTVLGNLYDVNITDSTFDQNVREKCIITQNGTPVFTGYLQLKAVNKSSPSQMNPDEQVSYDLQVKDQTGDFFSSMTDKLLEDLSGFTQYNHIYNFSAVTASSAHTWEDVYKYHLTYNLKPEYNLTDFTPNIFAKVYWDKIFQEAGYSYTWDSLSGTLFDKMVVPYNGDKPKANLDIIKFRAGFSGGTVTGFTDGSISNVPVTFNDDSATGATIPLEDGGGRYDTTTGVYTSDFFGQSTFKAAYLYELYIYNPCPNPVELRGIIEQYDNGTQFGGERELESELRITLNHRMGSLSGAAYTVGVTNGLFYDPGPQFFNPQIGSPTGRFILQPGYNLLYAGGSPEFTAVMNMIPGQKVQNWIEGQLEVNYRTPNDPYIGGWFDTVTNDQIIFEDIFTGQYYPRLAIVTNKQPTNYASNYFFNTPTAELGQNMQIVLPDFIPKKYKQKDFIANVTKLFNLYFTPDPENDKNLIIETRDEFYNNGGIVDWTDKFVVDDSAKIEFLPDLQNKKLKLTYKQDKDIYNSTYELATGEIYGQYEYEFLNQFVQGTKLIETGFSPTPLETNGTGIVVPTIDSAAPKNNIRILYDCGWIPTNMSSGSSTAWVFRSMSSSTTADKFMTYPHMGHFYPDPINPLYDLNFAQTDYLYYNEWNLLTDNNLYNNYYRRYLSQIENGKLLTGKFRLNEYDIVNLDLRDKIFIYDTYWFINTIKDYDTNSKDGLTTVELINVDDGIKFEPSNFTGSVIGNTYKWIKNRKSEDAANIQNTYGENAYWNNVRGWNNVIQGYSQGNSVAGSNNQIAGQGNYVSGTDNNVFTTNSFISGSGNTISGQGVLLFGSGNTIIGNNTMVFGDNLTGSASNTLYVNNIILPTGGTINGVPVSNISSLSGGPFLPLSGGVMSTGATISSANGGAYIALDAGGGANQVFLSSFSGSGPYESFLDLYDAGLDLIHKNPGGLAGSISRLTMYDDGSLILGVTTNNGGSSQFLNGFQAYSNFSGDVQSSLGLGLAGVSINSNFSTTLAGVKNSVILGGTNITATTNDTVYVPNLNLQTNKGLSFGTGATRIYQEIEIGDWNMLTTPNVNILHSLSATEWKTVRDISATIRNDADTVYLNLITAYQSSSGGTSQIAVTPSIFGLYRQDTIGNNGFDSISFTTTSYNRGWINFWYTPDV